MHAGRGIAAMFPKRPTSNNAFWAGFGTSGSLLAAAGVIFAIAAGVVAFTGWPDAPGAGTSTLRVSDGSSPVFDIPGSVQVAGAARAAAAAVTPPAPARTVPAGAGLVTGSGESGGSSPGTTGAGGGGTQVPQPPP